MSALSILKGDPVYHTAPASWVVLFKYRFRSRTSLEVFNKKSLLVRWRDWTVVAFCLNFHLYFRIVFRSLHKLRLDGVEFHFMLQISAVFAWQLAFGLELVCVIHWSTDQLMVVQHSLVSSANVNAFCSSK